MDILTYLHDSGLNPVEKEKLNAYIECPSCGRDKLSVNLTNGSWHCWNADCTIGGMKGSFYDLCKILKTEQGISVSFRKDSSSDEKQLSPDDLEQIMFANTNKAQVIEWATSRGLDGTFCLSIGIGFDKSTNSVVFPYRDEKGLLIGAKFKNERGQWIRGSEPRLYLPKHADLLRDKIVLVEGEVDAITIAQIGPPVCASLGATKSKGLHLLRDKKLVYVGYDMDPSGEAGVEIALKEIGAYKCRRVKWGDKDPNDWLQAGATKEDIINAIKAAKPVIESQTSLSGLEALNVYFAEHEKGVKPRSTFGYRRLDSFTKGFGGGELIGVLAESGTGKTTFILNLIRNQVLRGIKCGFASLEEHPIHEITPKLYSCLLGKNILNCGLTREDANSIEGQLRNVQLYKGKADKDSVMEWIKECYYLHGCKMVALDYFQLMVKDEESTQNIKATIFELKDLVKECHDLCIVLVIQPKQAPEWRNKDGSMAKAPKLSGSSARGGSAINQTVDKMLTIRGVAGYPNITQYEYTKVRGHLVVNKKDWLNLFTQLEYNHDTLRMTETEHNVFSN